MTSHRTRTHPAGPPAASRPRREAPARDAAGYPVFDSGDEGAAHVAAHRMLDSGRPGLGHRLLGGWLAGRTGSGSRWVHLHWHMAVFELAVGRWEEALERFHRHVLPAVPAGEALTDAPALLWRLALKAPGPVALPWEPVRVQAARRLSSPGDHFTELHHLLALAGAGDLQALEGWLARGRTGPDDAAGGVLRRIALSLRARLRGEAAKAASILGGALPEAGALGGSRAQRELLVSIHRQFSGEAVSGVGLKNRMKAA